MILIGMFLIFYKKWHIYLIIRLIYRN